MSESPAPQSAAPVPIQFRLIHVFYAMAVLGSCLAVFGPMGTFATVAVLVFWGYALTSPSRPPALARGCLVACVLGLCLTCCLAYPWTLSHPAELYRRLQCNDNLKEIMIALQSYHDVYHRFPPAYVSDKDGKPMHSWRVLILPFLRKNKAYDQYRFDEPWDGPNNRKLLDQLSGEPFHCPSDHPTNAASSTWTSYVAVIGPRTAWPGPRSRRMSEITDGTSNTVMVVAYHGGQIAWMEPRDPEIDEALRVLTLPEPEDTGGHCSENFFYEYFYGREVAFVDATAHPISHGTPPEVWSELLTIDDGVRLSQRELEGPWTVSRPKLGNWFRLAVLVLVTLWPLPWVWRKPK
jgi:hypothetical protein